MSLFRTYAAALLPAAIVLLGALQTALADNLIDATEAGQLIALFAGVGATYFVPLAGGAWAGLFKTGFAALAAVATLIIPFFTEFTWQALVIFALAILQAIATEIGVNARIIDARETDVVTTLR
jgi:hypothetical protein